MNDRPSRRAALWPGLIRLGGWLSLATLLGCATVPPPAAPPPEVSAGAHLLVTNQTDYDWNIHIASASGTEMSDTAVAPRATLSINLKGGDYVIDQSVTTAGATAVQTRRIPTHLAAGQTYRWRLDTLLSDPAGDPAK